MSLRLTIALTACLSVSACATVDLNEMGAQSKPTATKSVDVNVVQRATAKLVAAFSNRGFVHKDSRKKVRSATRVLLKGLEDKDVTASAPVSYASLATDKNVVLSDIRLASSQVEQTTKAAEVYLAMVPADKSVRKELVSLEKALIASREASMIFEDALLKTAGTANDLDYTSYKSSVNALRDVTNAFGDRVRESQMAKPNIIN
ncbi:hypothetical protein N9W89_00250 [Hellea sp.]|nr:hypothetical protein [Hellea sp.]